MIHEVPERRVRVAGVPICAISFHDAVEGLLDRAIDVSATRGLAVRLANSHTIATADADPAYADLLCREGVNLPDGKPLAMLVRWLVGSGSGAAQIRGPSLFEECLDQGRNKAIRHYFLGGSPDTLRLVVEKANRRYPGLIVAGSYSPPFRRLTDAELAAQDIDVVDSEAHIVWVGLGAPKQDVEATRLAESTGAVAVGVGAAFDFLAGTKPVAPRILRAAGLEWMFRLTTEPRRLWRRYLFGNLRFMIVALRALADQGRR